MASNENEESQPEHVRTSMQTSLASITAGIDNLESFLDQLTQTLTTQTREVVELNNRANRNREELQRIAFGAVSFQSPTLDPQSRRNEIAGTTPVTRMAGTNTVQLPASLRPSQLQMGRELGPSIRYPPHYNGRYIGGAIPNNGSILSQRPSTNEVMNSRRQEMAYAYPSNSYDPGRQLDEQVQFQSSPVTSSPVASTTSLQEAMERAFRAVVAAGRPVAERHLAELRRDWSFSVIGRVQPFNTQENSYTNEVNHVASQAEGNEANAGGESSDSSGHETDDDSGLDLEAWDRATSGIGNLLSDSEESDEDRMVFFGAAIVNPVRVESSSHDPRANHTEEERVSRRRIEAQRHFSPDTIHFYERIGISINPSDSAQYMNRFSNSVVLSNPRALDPNSEIGLGPCTPEPLYSAEFDSLIECIPVEKVEVTADTEQDEIPATSELDRNPMISDTLAVEIAPLQDESVSNNENVGAENETYPTDADLYEDGELEKLIEEFERKKEPKRTPERDDAGEPSNIKKPIPSMETKDGEINRTSTRCGKGGRTKKGKDKKTEIPKTAPPSTTSINDTQVRVHHRVKLPTTRLTTPKFSAKRMSTGGAGRN